MQIQIIDGIYADENADFRTALPINMVAVPMEQGISSGYMRPAEGIVTTGSGPGVTRGGINWNGTLYRVMGNQLVRVNSSGSVTNLGVIDGTGQVSFDYSFERLAVAGGGKLYYFDGATLAQVTDIDLGNVLDVIWIDGYFMTTDGNSLVVTELNDPFSVNPLKYGSSEVDPDPVYGLVKLRDEAYAINRYTIEVFSNIGGELFPFQRNNGALLPKGAMGTHCACVMDEQIAFLGGGRGEAPAIWTGVNSATDKISTREIDTILQGYSDDVLATALLETKVDRHHSFLYVHLPDQTLVYDSNASQQFGKRIWHILSSGLGPVAQYRGVNMVWVYNDWQVGDPASNFIGKLDPSISTHYGQVISWELSTPIVYNESAGAIFHHIELVSLPGRVAFGSNPVVWTSYSLDGETWSQDRPCYAGIQGDRTRRITWLRQGHMRNMRIQKFHGTSDAHISFARLEVRLEPLNG